MMKRILFVTASMMAAAGYGSPLEIHETPNDRSFAPLAAGWTKHLDPLDGAEQSSWDTKTMGLGGDARRNLQVNNNATESTNPIASNNVPDAVLFPSFCITVGVLVYYVLSRVPRLGQILPYTAAMFLVGVAMGAGSSVLANSDRRLNNSIQMWTNIDAQVLLLVFLPGLIYKEISIGLNVHIFRATFWQIILFAFPLVLAGATLTALVAYFLFPYKWTFNLCMILGTILAATDTVSVASLMNSLGASPRLKAHISGESLLNDGSVIVFFSIFVLKYLYELGIDGIGEDVNLPQGVLFFLRAALGSVAVGLSFGFATIFLIGILRRRFSQDENVMEVAAMLGLIYVGYFAADYTWSMSGVLATVVQGITIKLLGRTIMNDKKLLDDFWTLVENMLNTMLFTLGGIFWGDILVEDADTFTRIEWGYLFVLYVMLTIIRAFIFFVAYPLTKRIGLGACWQEEVFQVHAGLRGSVGIALALSLNNQIKEISQTNIVDPMFLDQTRKVFGFVGGIAFMTLVINAPTCKPLLVHLHLTESSDGRRKIIAAYRAHVRKQSIQDMVRLLAQHRFRYVNFAYVESHISFLSNLSKQELERAAEQHKLTTPKDLYREPHLDRILPYLIEINFHPQFPESDIFDDLTEIFEDNEGAEGSSLEPRHWMPQSTHEAQEYRALFLDILRSAYASQVSNGELADELLLTFALERSLDLASDRVANGEPLADWEFMNLYDPTVAQLNQKIKDNAALFCCLDSRSGIREKWKQEFKRLTVERAIAFMAAHRQAQDYFRREFVTSDGELMAGARIVVEESEAEWLRAEAALKKQKPDFVERAISHKFCAILLHSSILYISKLVRKGLLRSEEAEQWVGEVEQELKVVNRCHHAHKLATSAECGTGWSIRPTSAFDKLPNGEETLEVDEGVGNGDKKLSTIEET